MAFSSSSRVVASDDQVSTSIGGESVILGLNDGVYYGLDAVGARVWSLITEPVSVADLTAAVIAEFEVTPEQCERDLIVLLEDLERRGLVHEVSTRDDESIS